MALSFGEQIHALTGFDGDSADGSEIGENYDDITAEWMNMAVRQVINILPPLLKEKCTTETTLNHSATTIDLDTLGGEVLYVNRLSADSGGSRIPCRKVPSMYGELSNDSNSLYKASVTDPVYWILSSGDAAILNVIPTPTANQTAIVYHIGYPVFDADGSGSNINIKTATSITNFPDEAEYLVVLRAAMFAAKYQLAIEEDVELYTNVIGALKAQYQEGVLAIQTGSIVPQQKGKQ
jgi:hypothetical protein